MCGRVIECVFASKLVGGKKAVQVMKRGSSDNVFSLLSVLEPLHITSSAQYHSRQHIKDTRAYKQQEENRYLSG